MRASACACACMCVRTCACVRACAGVYACACACMHAHTRAGACVRVLIYHNVIDNVSLYSSHTSYHPGWDTGYDVAMEELYNM